MAKLIQVIEAEESRGKGLPDDPYRRVVVYYSVDGELLAERDDWKLNKEAKS